MIDGWSERHARRHVDGNKSDRAYKNHSPRRPQPVYKADNPAIHWGRSCVGRVERPCAIDRSGARGREGGGRWWPSGCADLWRVRPVRTRKVWLTGRRGSRSGRRARRAAADTADAVRTPRAQGATRSGGLSSRNAPLGLVGRGQSARYGDSGGAFGLGARRVGTPSRRRYWPCRRVASDRPDPAGVPEGVSRGSCPLGDVHTGQQVWAEAA